MAYKASRGKPGAILILMSSRILLFTGKGGVGKTTTAAATALRAAQLGYKTLVLSVDPAHSLADALDCPLGPEPRAIRENLYAQELDLYYSMKKHWGSIRHLLLTVFKWRGIDQIQAEELAVLPGMEEASAFLWLEQFYREGDFDLIVVDSAPTGETLTFLTLPQVTEWWVMKAIPFRKVAVKTVGAAVQRTTGVPLRSAHEELIRLFAKLKSIKEVITDPAITSIRIVLNPERMVIKEAQRAYTYLQLYGYPVDALITNRIMPALRDEVFAPYLQAQEGYLTEIDELFAPLPVFRVPHLGREVFGLDLLEQISKALWGETDPTVVFHAERPYRIEREDNAYRLRLHLPFLQGEELEVEQFGDGLVISLGKRRRNLVLPKFLSYYRVATHSLEGEWLSVWFIEGGS